MSKENGVKGYIISLIIMVKQLVLDNLRSIYNVGSILRTAEGFGVKQVSFIGCSPYPALKNDQRLPHLQAKQTEQIAKTALGAEKLIEGQYFAQASHFLSQVRQPIICLEQTKDSLVLADYQETQAICLVLGAETTGVSPELIKAAQTCLVIPMSGRKESFNVAVASGIALYHFNQLSQQ